MDSAIATDLPEYAFCETVTATGESPWHIRPLTDKGLKPGGGADTKSLCGRVVSWDVQVPITDLQLTHCCPECAQEFKL